LRESVHEILVGHRRREPGFAPFALDGGGEQGFEPLAEPVQLDALGVRDPFGERLDCREAIGLAAVFGRDAEFFHALEHDVEAPVGQRLGMSDDAGAADRVNRRLPVVSRLEPGPQQHHPDDAVAGERIRHHRPVPRLEDVQRHEHVGKQNGIRQREDRNDRREHLTAYDGSLFLMLSSRFVFMFGSVFGFSVPRSAFRIVHFYAPAI
jgi:hypothetical protein